MFYLVITVNVSLLLVVLHAFVDGITNNYQFTIIHYNDFYEAYIEMGIFVLAILGNLYMFHLIYKDKLKLVT